MVKKLALALALVLSLVAPAAAVPPVPADAELVGGGPAMCGEVMILRYVYAVDGGKHTLIVFKEPTHDPRISLKYDAAPGEGGDLIEAWVDKQKFDSIDAIRASYPSPCAIWQRA